MCPTHDSLGEPALMGQPHLLLEVLNPKTADFDQIRQYRQCRQLPSLRHHPLVWQTTQLIDWYQLTEYGYWSYTALVEAEDVVVIPELGASLTVAEVYEGMGVEPVWVRPPAAPMSADEYGW